MALPEEDRVLVLRVTRFQERHQLVVGLTEGHGRMSVVARNSIQSRRFGGSLGLFALAKWRFVIKPEAELGRLDEAVCIEPFEGLRGEWDTLSTATFFIELVSRVAPEYAPCPELFRLTVNALHFLSELGAHRTLGSSLGSVRLRFAAVFALKVLQWAGSQPRLSQCLTCERPLSAMGTYEQADDRLRMIVREAGWICSACSTHGQQTQYQETLGEREFYLPASTVELALSSMGRPIRESFRQGIEAPQNNDVAFFAWVNALLTFHVPGISESPLKSVSALTSETPRFVEESNLLRQEGWGRHAQPDRL